MLASLIALAMAAPPEMKLLWADEFDGPALDAAKWTVEVNADGGGNNELQYYTARPENVRVEGGELVITTRKERYVGADGKLRDYTSGRVNTAGKFAPQFGRIEARMKVPLAHGMWPAFWMLGADIDRRGWPGCGEIDIMEAFGNEPGVLYGTIHGDGFSGAAGLASTHVYKLEGYHVYAVDWDPDGITWSVDGKAYAHRGPGDLPRGSAWPFRHPFFLLINSAIGGNRPGKPDDATGLPQELRVDYVRVWGRP